MAIHSINQYQNDETLLSVPRRLIMFVTFCLAILSASVNLASQRISFVYVCLFPILGIMTVWFGASRQRKYYTPLVWGALFLVSYVLSLSQILVSFDEIPNNGFGGIGVMQFDNERMLDLSLIMTVGLLGIFCATLMFEKLTRNRHCSGTKILYMDSGRAKNLLYWWAGLSFAVEFLMWRLQIGRTGLVHGTHLPFKLVGSLVYIRFFTIPMLGLLFLDYFVRNGEKKLVVQSVFLLLAIGLVGSVTGLSKLPLVLSSLFIVGHFTMFWKYYKKWFRSKLIVVLGGIGVLLIVMIVGILVVTMEQLRTYYYGIGLGTNFEWNGPYEAILQYEGEVDIRDSMSLLTDMILQRTIGIRELLVVFNSTSIDWSWERIWEVIISDDDEKINEITFALYGSVPDASDGKAFGIGYGLWGTLLLGGSYWYIFIGTFIYVLFALAVEELFDRSGIKALALGAAIIMRLQLWGGASISFFWVRLASISVFTYAIVRYVTGRFMVTTVSVFKILEKT